MFTLNTQTNRYEATLKAGTLVSISSKRFEDDAHNLAVMAFDCSKPYSKRLASAKVRIMEHPDMYRTRNNGFSVVVISVKSLRK